MRRKNIFGKGILLLFFHQEMKEKGIGRDRGKENSLLQRKKKKCKRCPLKSKEKGVERK